MTPKPCSKWPARCRFELRDGEVCLDGRNVESLLHGDAVDAWVAAHSAIPGVRDIVNARLREIAAAHDAVVEGRDIGTVVFPGRPGEDLPRR